MFLERHHFLAIMPRDVGAYLSEQQRKSSGDLATEWGTIEELYNKKLWHQLTLKLLIFVKNPVFSKGDGLLRLYENVIADFEHRINPLALMEIVIFVVKQITDSKQALEFLEKINEKVKSSDEARILCMTQMGTIKLRNKDFDGTKALIEEAKKLLDCIDGVTTIHGRFYELSSNYHKLMGNHAEYYKDALRYLGCINLEDIPSGEQTERAFNLGLAAILGDGVYNFGELLAHPILESLKSTDRNWLVDLLFAFNSGNISQFEILKKSWVQQPDLAGHEVQMRQKISLLCLMEMTFRRPATNRQLTFQEIASEARITLSEVEMLVMKALSLSLVKGSIDEVDEKVHVTWVQPRVLDVIQISTMQSRLKQWCEDVKQMEKLVEVRAHDILT
ncbi:26S proteasome non-ATPase regulatory subunit 13-like [Gigantopelta aegis]|uniref:26S proteasome non-ATPase regulatory subunit 13-like n=1 Tax=Gigantopelta aegis TaxID=1735272 RepID=UPI001B88C9CF|nr:26S proteasome non-ATPase regulatory subunit 13-like [Gigantopelta aegis]